MKIFLTGATGFIGANLVGQLQKAGHTLHVLHRNNKEIPRLTDTSRIRLFNGDIMDTQSLAQAMKGCEQVYHLAAYAKNWSKDHAQFMRINVTGTRNVLEAAMMHGVQKVVVTSTTGTLGPSDARPMDESRLRIKAFFTEYERTKFLAEEEVKKYHAKGLPAVIVNPSRVFGPGLLSESNAATKIIRWYIQGKWRILLGKGDKLGNYVFIDDVVKGHILAMEKGQPGQRYILGGSNLSLSQYLDLIAQVSGKKYQLFSLPVAGAMAIAQWEALWAKHTNYYPLITPAWLEKYNYHWAVSSRKAEKELGYQITPMRQALRVTIKALQNMEVRHE